MTSSGIVLYEVFGRSAWVTMNRPEVLNALSEAMFRDMKEAIRRATESNVVRFVVITGAGNAFSAGLDIKQVGGFGSYSKARSFVYQLVKPFWEAMFECDKPILAVVNGPAYGAGAEIALASDIVLASSGSRFAFSGGRVGALCCISPIIGPLMMSGRKASEMNLSGDPISAKEARSLGLVNYVVAYHKLRATTNSLITRLGRVSPISNSSFKKIRNATISKTLLATAYRELLRTITNPEFRIGSEAFIAKKTPEF